MIVPAEGPETAVDVAEGTPAKEPASDDRCRLATAESPDHTLAEEPALDLRCRPAPEVSVAARADVGPPEQGL